MNLSKDADLQLWASNHGFTYDACIFFFIIKGNYCNY